MLKRILIAIPALALLFGVIYFHGIFTMAVVGLVAVLCVHEMMGALAKSDARPIRPIGYAFAALIVPTLVFAEGLGGTMLLAAAALICTFVVLVLSGRDAADGMATGLPVLYPGILLVFVAAIVVQPAKEISQFLLLCTFIVAVITDTFAYFTGLLLGKHKLIESISPKKTIEGAVGGTVFGSAAFVAFGVLAQGAFGVSVSTVWYALLGITLSILSQFGDLSASLVKRKCGVKDYGRIMGDHGGVMDRLDSVLFISPAVYAFYIFAIQ